MARDGRTVTSSRPFIAFFLWHVLSFATAGAPDPSSRIRFLPGFNGSLPFEFYTGYIDVGENDENHLFYYFIKSEGNPAEDPLLLWLAGGPGCSGFSGLAFEIGPMKFEAKGFDGSLPKLVLNPYSWTKVSNVIFLDSPTGTGFSYSNSSEDYWTGDTKLVKDIYRFLIKWLLEYPEFTLNPVYIAGDSYSGITVPLLVHEIATGNMKKETQEVINIKGYVVGNPRTDPDFDNMRVSFAHGMGIISEELYDATKRSCKGRYTTPDNHECISNLDAVNECLSGLYGDNILEPNCKLALPRKMQPRELNEISMQFWLPPDIPFLSCREFGHALSYFWANDKRVREALRVHEGSIGEWLRCNWTVSGVHKHEVRSVLKYHRSLTLSGYRALVYSGDHDLNVPFMGTQKWISSFNYSVIDPWRPWWVDGQIAGYTRSYDHNVTFATVKGAGHTAPEYKPKECQAMLQRWLSYTPL